MDDGRYMTLAIVFNPERTHVLMCFHKKQSAYNFVGGHSQVGEDYDATTYRELYGESGISKDAIDLQFLRIEKVTCAVPNYPPCWTLYLMTGVLKHDVVLKEENNHLQWVPVTEHLLFQYDSFGNGNCWLYLCEAACKLGIELMDTVSAIPGDSEQI